jgi:microcystin-dependent protein
MKTVISDLSNYMFEVGSKNVDEQKLAELLDRTKIEYVKLYETIGYTYGGAYELFAVPNLVGRVVVGEKAGTGNFELGEKHGASTVVLTTEQLAKHGHTVTDSGHQHQYAGTQRNPVMANTSGLNNAVKEGEEAGEQTFAEIKREAGGSNPHIRIYKTPKVESAKASVTATETGLNEAHQNMPPYLVLNYIIKL